MPNEKITINYEDLKTPAVEERLERLQVSLQTREHFESRSAMAIDPLTAARHTSIWYNTIFYMAFFGLLGALLGWAAGELVYRPDPLPKADELAKAARLTFEKLSTGQITDAEANSMLRIYAREGRDNPYYRILMDNRLSGAERDRLISREQWKQFFYNSLFYGICGLAIAMCLSMAESVVSRNVQGMIVFGSVGALAGLLGGIAVSLFIHQMDRAIRTSSLLAGLGADSRELLAIALSWGVLGLFLSLGPGVVMRSSKRLLIGIAGGLAGGLLGGVLYSPISRLAGNEHVALAAAIVAIGVGSGLGTGLIENAAKSGWLKVVEGLIAGKQFILYRNPTYIGSAPNCEIYLFKDARVGKRHAAIRIVPGGFELEDLPLGEATIVNGEPITRRRLRPGDQIRIGSTAFLFQEKVKAG